MTQSGRQWGIQQKHDTLEGVPLEVEWGCQGLVLGPKK